MVRGVVRIAALPSPVSPIIARDRDASKREYLDSYRSACRRYFTGMIIGYPFGVTTVIFMPGTAFIHAREGLQCG